MMPARIEVDFIPQRRRLSFSGIVLLIVGVVTAAWVFDDLRSSNTAVELLEISIARYDTRSSGHAATTSPHDSEAVTAATRQLMTPWSQLLTDLEQAALDSDRNVALLEVAPDKNKRSVRVSGEARSLEHAIAYVERLQAAPSLRAPLLENHEVQTSNNERPVRFVVLADWRVEG